MRRFQGGEVEMTSWKPSAKVSGGGGRDDFMEAKCEGFRGGGRDDFMEAKCEGFRGGRSR